MNTSLDYDANGREIQCFPVHYNTKVATLTSQNVTDNGFKYSLIHSNADSNTVTFIHAGGSIILIMQSGQDLAISDGITQVTTTAEVILS